tara:strand:+ start:496 stop:648 length:153 start_codon:yes stop_codon:yes gene_type:complete
MFGNETRAVGASAKKQDFFDILKGGFDWGLILLRIWTGVGNPGVLFEIKV